MAVPKRRKTKRKTRQGRSHHALTASKLGKCENCGFANLPHQICQNCGAHRGKLPESATKDEKKSKEKSKEKK